MINPEIRLINSRNKQLSIYIFCTLLSLAYFVSYWNYGLNFWDEGVPLSGAMRLENGDWPIRDFKAYAPAQYLLYAIGSKCLGGSFEGPRLGMAIIGSLISLLILVISNRMLTGWIRFLPYALYLLTPVQYFYRFFTLAVLLSVIVLQDFHKEYDGFRIFRSSVFSLCISWLREDVGAIFMIIIAITSILRAVILKNMPRHAWLSPLFACLSFSLFILYSGGTDDARIYFQAIYDTAITNKDSFSLDWPHVWDKGYWLSRGFFLGFQGVIIWSGLFTFLSFSGFWILRNPKNSQIFALVMGNILVFNLMIFRPGYSNFHRALPLISIAFCVLLQKIDSPRFFKVIFYFVASLLLIFIVLDSLFIFPEQYQSIGMMWKFNQSIVLKNAILWVNLHNKCVIEEMIASINDYLYPSDSLVCLPFNPIWNYLSDHQNPTFYEWILPGEHKTKAEQEILIENFSNKMPDMIIINDYELDDHYDRKFSIQHAELFKWILKNYVLVVSIKNYGDLYLSHHKVAGENISGDVLHSNIQRVEGTISIRKSSETMKEEEEILMTKGRLWINIYPGENDAIKFTLCNETRELPHQKFNMEINQIDNEGNSLGETVRLDEFFLNKDGCKNVALSLKKITSEDATVEIINFGETVIISNIYVLKWPTRLVDIKNKEK